MKLNILVMAVGSPLGQSIVKALAHSSLAGNIHVADINDMAAGFYFSNVKPVVLPLVASPDYFTTLKEYVLKHKITVIFPVLSIEHDVFNTYMEFFNENNIHVISCSPEAFTIANDKLQSMNFLQKNNLNAPDTILANDSEEIGLFLERNTFPVILKPRFGASSANVFIVKDKQRLEGLICAFGSGFFVLQQFLADEDDYTVGVYRSRNKKFQETFIIKRKLNFGLSYSGSIVCNSEISQYCLNVAEALDSCYSINIQFKLLNGQPYAYEINPRLSSTTCIRAHFGFNEPHMILKDIVNDPVILDSKPKTEGRFMRFWSEHYLEN